MASNLVSLKTLKDSPLQRIFDQVAVGLLLQNKRSLSFGYGGQCAYRSPNGSKCGIGFLIADIEYLEKFEGRNISDVLDANKIHLSNEKTKFLSHIQRIHDNTPVSEWKNKLQELSKLYNLGSQACDNAKQFWALNLPAGAALTNITTGKTVKITGKAQTWVTRPQEFRLKHSGQMLYGTINQSNIGEWK